MPPYRYGGAFAPYVSVAERRKLAAQKTKVLAKQRAKEGGALAPVVITGKDIASTFWGKAWCQNLLRYSDYATRLPRGRSYVRNGAVIDLQITPGLIKAVVSGSELYEIDIALRAVGGKHWDAIRKDCTGAIASLLELLQGRLSTAVMERLCRPQTGLFPAPAEIELSCSCPDAAEMCKHIAAVLYGVGARLDEAPELLFVLRKIEAAQLLAGAEADLQVRLQVSSGPSKRRRLADDSDLGGLFGLDMAAVPAPPPAPKPRAKKRSR
jgi:uncharacterized Zn finger protein